MPAFICKAIKPKKLKLEAVTIELQKVIQQIGAGAEKDFGRTVATWKHKPNFEVVTDVSGTEVSTLVGTDYEI